MNQRGVIACLVGMVGVALCTVALAGPDQATKDRCSAYAQRAVAQYQSMTSNPQCVVKDDLRWQGNLDNHYKGCLMLPEFLRKSEEAARDDHLQACGGAVASNAAAAPAAPASAADSGAAMAGPSTSSPNGDAQAPSALGPASKPAPVATSSADMASGSTATGSPAGKASPGSKSNGCSQRPPDYYYAEKLQPAGVGVELKFADGVFSYKKTVNRKFVSLSYKVTRPAYLVAFFQCSGAKENPLHDQYVWISDDGKQAMILSPVPLGGQVYEYPVSPSFARRLIREK